MGRATDKRRENNLNGHELSMAAPGKSHHTLLPPSLIVMAVGGGTFRRGARHGSRRPRTRRLEPETLRRADETLPASSHSERVLQGDLYPAARSQGAVGATEARRFEQAHGH